jgi:hypothetical protein
MRRITTARVGNRSKRAAASSARVPATLGAEADKSLAMITEDQNTAIMILTQTGKQSRIVSLNKRFSRADGEAMVAELAERAKAINARDDRLCGISELRLFGSMLDPKPRRSVMRMSRMSFSTSSHHRGNAEANGTLEELSNLVGIFSFVK